MCIGSGTEPVGTQRSAATGTKAPAPAGTLTEQRWQHGIQGGEALVPRTHWSQAGP